MKCVCGGGGGIQFKYMLLLGNEGSSFYLPDAADTTSDWKCVCVLSKLLARGIMILSVFKTSLHCSGLRALSMGVHHMYTYML